MLLTEAAVNYLTYFWYTTGMSVIDDYFEHVSPSQKTELERIRKIVKRIVPKAEETIGYGMPVFKYNGKYLIGLAAFKDHMSIFPGAEPVEVFKDKLRDFKTSKGTVQFTLDNPIPESLLKEIVITCLNRSQKS